MKDEISKEVKQITNINPKRAYKAIHRLLFCELEKEEILDAISRMKAKDSAREFQLKVGHYAILKGVSSIAKHWNGISGGGRHKQYFFQCAALIGGNWIPGLYHLLADSLLDRELVDEGQSAWREVRHVALLRVLESLGSEGVFVAGYYATNGKKALPDLLVGQTTVRNEAVQLAKFICDARDREIVELMESLLPAAGKDSIVRQVVYSDNPESVQKDFVAEHRNLAVDDIVYVDRDYRNVRSISRTRDLGRVEFEPTGLVDKQALLSALEVIRNRRGDGTG